MLLKIKSSVVMVFVISPAWLIDDNFTTAVTHWFGISWCEVHWLQVVSQFVRESKFVSQTLMNILLLESAAKISLKHILFSEETKMGLQMRESFVKFTHEDCIISFTKVSMVITAELIVTVNHMTDATHGPLDGFHRANSISITVHHGNRSVRNILDGNIGSDSVLLSLKVRLGILLESSFDAHLEEVSECAS